MHTEFPVGSIVRQLAEGPCRHSGRVAAVTDGVASYMCVACGSSLQQPVACLEAVEPAPVLLPSQLRVGQRVEWTERYANGRRMTGIVTEVKRDRAEVDDLVHEYGLGTWPIYDMDAALNAICILTDAPAPPSHSNATNVLTIGSTNGTVARAESAREAELRATPGGQSTIAQVLAACWLPRDAGSAALVARVEAMAREIARLAGLVTDTGVMRSALRDRDAEIARLHIELAELRESPEARRAREARGHEDVHSASAEQLARIEARNAAERAASAMRGALAVDTHDGDAAWWG